MMMQLPSNPHSPESTDLERRVLAHERILQSLIAHMSRLEPSFLDHLKRVFVEPMEHARREQNHIETDDYAEEFIHAVVALGETERARERVTQRRGRGSGPGTPPEEFLSSPHPRAERVRTYERHGVWTVDIDGVAQGDYHRRENAEAAAALAKLSLR